MKNNNHPNIAFFDSSQGGLTVWENVLRRYPNLNTQYLGDNARCPYGNKSAETIIKYAAEAALFLSNRNANLLIVACGTASSVAAKEIQKIFKIPIIGIVEGFCQFVGSILKDKSRTVAVLGTRFTIKSKRFKEELSFYDVNRVWERACPLFVPLVEEGISTGPMADAAADMYLWDIPEDTKIVMLACTHYPRLVHAIADSIERRLGKTIIYKTIDGDWVLKIGHKDESDPIYLVESSLPIVSYISNFLHKNNSTGLYSQGEKHVFCTDSPEQFESIARFFTTISLPKVEAVDIQT
ncbi:glutamate racemase [Fluviispira multicolorata]|uniref:Glutamate racemase n=1 Tax=Fluviispira multicolorata TaxID=2654512 RepID=A0A833N166_9BACT|nr:glutamate racemase [Fluviispira multicolorata]KAB8029940.1 glutamate racemase [Fluviispira multicolorata]